MSLEPNPVEPCKGWNEPCVFCNKRFREWEEAESDELLQKIPNGALAYIFAFDSKQGKEIVVIGFHEAHGRQAIASKLDSLRQRVSQKKFKETKSSILVKWSSFSEPKGKDACTLFAHWINYGILPRLTPEWPGEGILKSTNHYQFSTGNTKWCQNTKDAVWKKTKSIVAPQAIKKCRWLGSCTFCDNRFSPIVALMEANEKNLAPQSPGIAMISVKKGKINQTILIASAETSLQACFKDKTNWIKNVLTYDKLLSASIDEVFIRWMVLDDLRGEESCFVYAHFLNAEEEPLLNRKHQRSASVPGETELLNNNKFSFRDRDSQWCYDNDSKQKLVKYSKTKEKRLVQQSIADELLMANS